MPDPHVRIVGEVDDIDGRLIKVGVDYDSVSVAFAGFEVRLNAGQAEQFAKLFVAASWQAGIEMAVGKWEDALEAKGHA